MSPSKTNERIGTNSDSCRFKAFYWHYEETQDNKSIIHVSGLDRRHKTVYVKIINFTPLIYLQLPTYVNGNPIQWNRGKCQQIFEYLESRKDLCAVGAPISFIMQTKELLYIREKVYTMTITFPTHAAIRKVNNIFSGNKRLYIPGVGGFPPKSFFVVEHNIEPLFKFACQKNIKMASWMKIKQCDDVDDDEIDFSTCDRNFVVDWMDVEYYEPSKEIIIRPKYCSFDIECHSVNPDAKLPNPKHGGNIVFQIAMIFGRIGDTKMKTYGLTLFDPPDIEGVEMVKCQDERELLLSFHEIVQEEDPDLFITFNGMKFDWHYMMERAECPNNIISEFMMMSRLNDTPALSATASWSSSAYGHQSFSYPNCHGRFNIDVLLEVERNYKMPNYNLNSVAAKFLGEQKDDISPSQIFMSVELCNQILPMLRDIRGKFKKLNKRRLDKIRIKIRIIMPRRKTHGIIRKMRRKLLETETAKELDHLIRTIIQIILKYCIQDTILPIKLVNKLNLLTTMEQMSNVMHVPMSYLHTRGQQIKVVAQVYRETKKDNVIIPSSTTRVNNEQNYQGAVVIEANPGDYDNVPTLDFSSLYPTTMIAYNICYTTFVLDSNPISDDECHVLVWSDHVKCIHDPQKRKPKKNKEDVLCQDHHYRFRKVKTVIREDGTIERLHEGIMSKLERNLLSTRKEVKKELFKAQARLAMQKGTATSDEIAKYKSYGFEIIEKGQLTPKEEEILSVVVGVLDAKQLAIKVSANSVVADSPIPCLVDGCFRYLKIEDIGDFDAGYQTDNEGNQYVSPKDGIMVWSDKGLTKPINVIRHPNTKKLYKIRTKMGEVICTEDHSLLRSDGTEVKPSELKEGGRLMHKQPDMPHDIPNSRSREFGAKSFHDLNTPKSPIKCDFDEMMYTAGTMMREFESKNDQYTFQNILSLDYKSRMNFLMGYSASEFFLSQETCTNTIKIHIQNPIETSIVCYLARSVGFHVHFEYFANEYILNLFDSLYETTRDFPRAGNLACEEPSSGNFIDSENYIIEIVEIDSATKYGDYVYDLETKSHHFATGVGDIVVHNSAYGALGARKGFIPFIPGAASVTAMGRKLILMAIDKIKKEFPTTKLVYGDSVTGDTPILCKKDGLVYILPIENLHLLEEYKSSEDLYPEGLKWSPYKRFKLDDSVRENKECVTLQKEIKVWCGDEKGWQNLKRIIRHNVHKKIYRVATRNGTVDVTEDHSLLKSNGEEIKAGKANLGDELLTGFPSIDDTNFNFITAEEAKKIGEDLAERSDCNIFPVEILNSTTLHKIAFLEGYGNTKSQNKVICQGLYYIYKSISDAVGLEDISGGYYIFEPSVQDTPREHIPIFTPPSNDCAIRKIDLLSDKKQKVYDLETECGRFQAGIGEIIVRNTDSCMLQWPELSLENSFERAEFVSGMVSHFLKCHILGFDENEQVRDTKTKKKYRIDKVSSKDKIFKYLSDEDKIKVIDYESNPIDLEFENMYIRFFLLTKKRYIAYIGNKKGEIIDVVKKGVVLKRRDNCKYLRDSYDKISKGVLDKEGEQYVMNILYDKVQALFTRQISPENFIIYMGVGKIEEYATNKKVKKDGKAKEILGYFDENNVQFTPTGPLDPRLVYPNYPQCLLALKMLRRGTDVPPNTRLEYIYLENKDAEHQGEKAEDFTYFSENKKYLHFKPDYLHYLEKQFSKPVQEILNVKFPKEIIIYEPIDDQLKRISTMREVNEDRRANFSRMKRYEYLRPRKRLPEKIGWDAYEMVYGKGMRRKYVKQFTLAPDKNITYKFTKQLRARAEYVCHTKDTRDANAFSTKRPKERECIEICEKWRARDILNNMYRQHGITKRPCKKPTQYGKKLRPNTQVVFLNRCGDIAKGDFGKIISRTEISKDEFEYDILIKNDIIVKGIPRNKFGTYYRRDGKIMQDIYKARYFYKAVVTELNQIFSEYYSSHLTFE
jgi:DNA polymerase elongation subunit (family B)